MTGTNLDMLLSVGRNGPEPSRVATIAQVQQVRRRRPLPRCATLLPTRGMMNGAPPHSQQLQSAAALRVCAAAGHVCVCLCVCCVCVLVCVLCCVLCAVCPVCAVCVCVLCCCLCVLISARLSPAEKGHPEGALPKTRRRHLRRPRHIRAEAGADRDPRDSNPRHQAWVFVHELVYPDFEFRRHEISSNTMALITSDCGGNAAFHASNGPKHLGLWCNAAFYASNGPNRLGLPQLIAELDGTAPPSTEEASFVLRMADKVRTREHGL